MHHNHSHHGRDSGPVIQQKNGTSISKAKANKTIDYANNHMLYLADLMNQSHFPRLTDVPLPLNCYSRMYVPLDPVLDKYIQHKKVEVSESKKDYVQMRCCEFNSDGRFILAGIERGDIVYHNTYDFSYFYMETIHKVGKESGSSAFITRLRVLPTGENDILTSSGNGYVVYLDNFLNRLPSKECYGKQVHKGCITDMAIAGDGSHFVTCCDKTAIVSHLSNSVDTCFKTLVTISGFDSSLTSLACHPFSPLLLIGEYTGGISLWDLRINTKNKKDPVGSHAHILSAKVPRENKVSFLNWNSVGTTYVVGSCDKRVRIYDIRNPSDPVYIISLNHDPTCMKWNPVLPSTFAVGDSGGNVSFFDLAVAHEVNISGTYPVSPLDDTSLESLLGISTLEQSNDPIRLRPLETITRAHRSTKDTQQILDLAYHPNGHVLATIGDDKDMRFWSCNRPGTLLHDIFHHSGDHTWLNPADERYSHNQSHRIVHATVNTAADRLNQDELSPFYRTPDDGRPAEEVLIPGLLESRSMSM